MFKTLFNAGLGLSMLMSLPAIAEGVGPVTAIYAGGNNVDSRPCLFFQTNNAPPSQRFAQPNHPQGPVSSTLDAAPTIYWRTQLTTHLLANVLSSQIAMPLVPHPNGHRTRQPACETTSVRGSQ